MIIYFSNRYMSILGKATNYLPDGLTIKEDYKTEDVETGVATFECYIPYDSKTRGLVDVCTSVGNYILCKDGYKNKFYTIIDRDKDTKNNEIYVYAEDAGLDLLNEMVGPYAAEEAYSIEHYINEFTLDSGFEIGINEAADLTRKLSWEGEATATERIASVATQFDNCEISYDFEIRGLEVSRKLINIHKKRGQETGVQLRLNLEVDRIITKESIANLATALRCTGGMPEDSETAITLKGYSYDDGDFYVGEDGMLRSRKALEKWSRYIWTKEPSQQEGYAGHIVRNYSYDTTSQATLCAHAVTELKKICEIEVNYEISLQRLPEGVKVGDRVSIVDDAGGLYLSTRILKIRSSETEQTHEATLGEYLIKDSGISQKVADLAKQFAESTESNKRAENIATNAKDAAEDAKEKADAALKEAESAKDVAEGAQEQVTEITGSISESVQKVEEAKAQVEKIVSEVGEIEQVITNAQQAAENAYQAAETAQQKAEEAEQAVANAERFAEEAAEEAEQAAAASEAAIQTAQTAQNTAAEAKGVAEEAQSVAAGARADAAIAQAEIEKFAENLTTVEQTMKADYARKTDLTEAKANLQSQITQSASLLSSTVSMLTMIDETTNNAESLAQKAQAKAAEARAQADQATLEAEQAQTYATQAAQAAANAQAEADTAREAADTAKSVADAAQEGLDTAKAELAEVLGRADATEEEIAAAQAAVDEAREAVEGKKAEADEAVEIARNAQSVADSAYETALEAQAEADAAADFAKLAQSVANDAEAAYDAQVTADSATQTAASAQETANAAIAEAASAQSIADEAAAEAQAAQAAAAQAEADVVQAQNDLINAQKNLTDVTNRVGATEKEVEDAREAVTQAQAAADKAKADAVTAQNIANTAKSNADAAQTAATNAKNAADKAQADAQAAQAAADKAQTDVNALKTRVTNAETKITQNANQIALMATKTEVTETLGGYYTKTEADAAIEVSANGVRTEVTEVKTTASDNEARLVVAETLLQQLSDSISMLVTDSSGASLMTQTANGWTFSTTSLQNSIDSTSKSLDDLTQEVGSTEAAVGVLEQAVADLEATAEYVRIGTWDDEETGETLPCVELGEGDSDFALMITNKKILFRVGSGTPTRITTEGLETENITVQNELRHANFSWQVRANGNYGLSWKGGS
jgi:phage minor structural protein